MKHIAKFAIVGAAALALVACTVTKTDPGSPAVLNADGSVKTAAVPPSETKVIEDPLSALIDWIHTDGAPKVIAALQIVSKDAAAHQDSTAQQCWDGAQPVVALIDQMLQGVKAADGNADSLPKDGIGWALWLVQKKRDLKGDAGSGIGNVRQVGIALHNACDALANDEIKGKFDLFGFFSGQAKTAAAKLGQ